MFNISESFDIDSESYRNQEEQLLGRIVRLLSSILHRFLHTPCDILESLSELFPAGKEDNVTGLPQLLDENSDDFDDDTWGITGLIIGLGMSVGAIYRAGKKDVVVKIKNLIASWIPYADSHNQTSDSKSKVLVRIFSAGSCLALPAVITFYQKVELFDAHEVDRLINCFKDLIFEFVIVKKSGAFHKSLLMASCIGAGDLLGSVLNEGIHPVEIESIKRLLELFKKCYSGLNPPFVQFGGMLGVVNVLGVGAGNLVYSHPPPRAPTASSEENEISHVSGPLLSNSYFTQQLTPVDGYHGSDTPAPSAHEPEDEPRTPVMPPGAVTRSGTRAYKKKLQGYIQGIMTQDEDTHGPTRTPDASTHFSEGIWTTISVSSPLPKGEDTH